MKNLKNYLNNLENPHAKEKFEEIFTWILDNYKTLQTKIAWNQPMFTNKGTFILAFSASKKHFSIAPEEKAILKFENQIKKTGYSYTKKVIRVPYDSNFNYNLLKQLIDYNIKDKLGYEKFWR